MSGSGSEDNQWVNVTVNISKELYDKLDKASQMLCMPGVPNKIVQILGGWEQGNKVQ